MYCLIIISIVILVFALLQKYFKFLFCTTFLCFIITTFSHLGFKLFEYPKDNTIYTFTSVAETCIIIYIYTVNHLNEMGQMLVKQIFRKC